MTAGPAEDTLERLAALVGGSVSGNGALVLHGVTTLQLAGPHDLGLLADRAYLGALGETRAGALLVSEELDEEAREMPNRLVVENPRSALALLLEHFHIEPARSSGIHATAILGSGVQLGEDVSIGPYVVIEDDVVIGDRSTLHAHVVIRQGSKIGADTVLHPQVVVYPYATVGDRVVLHAGARIGVDGFGYASDQGAARKIPHVGACIIGDRVEIGANSCVDRGSIGKTEVGDRTKLDNLVHIAHNVTVGSDSFLAAQVGIAGSTKIGARTLFGGQAGVADHLTIGEGAKIAGQAGVIEDVPDGATMAGFPARPIQSFHRATAALYRIAELRRRVSSLERALRSETEDQDTE